MIENIVLIKSGKNIYGIDSESIHTIIDTLPITSVPLASSEVAGVCSIDGKIAVCIDFNCLLNCFENAEKNKMVVVEINSAIYAFLVEDVLDIKFLEKENFEIASDDELIEGFYKQGKDEEDIIQILKINALIEKTGSFCYTPLDIADVTNSLEETKSVSEKKKPFIFFQLKNEFFAIDTDLTKELIFANRKITPLAEADAEILGIVTIRGKAVNVADFNMLLNGENSYITETSRFLIIHNEKKDVALLVDKIIDIKDIELDKLEKLQGKDEDKKIEGLYKDNENIVSVISSFYLKNFINKHYIKEDAENNAVEEDEAMIEVAAFKIGEEEYAINIDEIQETIKYSDVTPVPETSEYIKGVINLRGEVVPVASLPLRLGFEETINKDTKIIVCSIRGYKIGFLVDDVNEILFVEEKFVSKNDDKNAIVNEIINIDNGRRVILKLNLTSVIDEEELKSISSSASEAGNCE